MNTQIKLHYSWLLYLEDEFNKQYMQKLKYFLLHRKKVGVTIFPSEEDYFNALKSTPLDDVKVVIIGQDPYHGAGQAHGLCFSVQKGVKVPERYFSDLSASQKIQFTSGYTKYFKEKRMEKFHKGAGFGSFVVIAFYILVFSQITFVPGV